MDKKKNTDIQIYDKLLLKITYVMEILKRP